MGYVFLRNVFFAHNWQIEFDAIVSVC